MKIEIDLYLVTVVADVLVFLKIEKYCLGINLMPLKFGTRTVIKILVIQDGEDVDVLRRPVYDNAVGLNS